LKESNLFEWGPGHGYRFTHDWFRFPGKFHPPLIEHILKSINPTGVVDPMAGVGTVAVEAKAAGIPSLSLDIDPVSVFFTRAKTTPVSSDTLKAAWKYLSASLDEFRREKGEIEIRKFRDLRVDLMRKELDDVGALDLKKLSYWFRRYVLVDYARIDHAIYNGGLPGRSEYTRRFFLACLISSIRRISYADPSPVSGLEITKHMREKFNDGYEVDVFGEFGRRVDLAIRRMDEYVTYLKEKGTYDTPCCSLQGDSANLSNISPPRDFTADLILFSPPYCNAIEYWRRHRLEYLLGHFLDEQGIIQLHKKFIGRRVTGAAIEPIPRLGFPPIDDLLRDLVGEKRSHKARLLYQYFDDMEKRLMAFHGFLPDNGSCIIVVGDSKTGERRIPTADTLAWLGQEKGFRHMGTSQYDIKDRVMQFPVKSNSKIERESIIFLRKA